METGINSIEGLLTPARGFRSSRHTCRKPLLFDPAQSACHQEGGGPLSLLPLEWSGFAPARQIALKVAHVLGLYHGATATGLVTHPQCGKRQKKSPQVASRGKGEVEGNHQYATF